MRAVRLMDVIARRTSGTTRRRLLLHQRRPRGADRAQQAVVRRLDPVGQLGRACNPAAPLPLHRQCGATRSAPRPCCALFGEPMAPQAVRLRQPCSAAARFHRAARARSSWSATRRRPRPRRLLAAHPRQLHARTALSWCVDPRDPVARPPLLEAREQIGGKPTSLRLPRMTCSPPATRCGRRSAAARLRRGGNRPASAPPRASMIPHQRASMRLRPPRPGSQASRRRAHQRLIEQILTLPSTRSSKPAEPASATLKRRQRVALQEMRDAFELFAPVPRRAQGLHLPARHARCENDAIFRTAEGVRRDASRDAGLHGHHRRGGGIMQSLPARRRARAQLRRQHPTALRAAGQPESISRRSKLLMFNYFFTRKLFFIKEAHAVALFPGGFGTHDEGFEVLTLLQTGKCQPLPRRPARPAARHVLDDLAPLRAGTTCCAQADLRRGPRALQGHRRLSRRRCAKSPAFYRVYHSARYVRDLLVAAPQPSAAAGAARACSGAEFADIM